LRSNVDIYTTAENLRNKLDEVILEKKQILIKFVDYLESYTNMNGEMPSIEYCKETILPLFEK
jgi:predicted nuclease with TOPRIM domain